MWNGGGRGETDTGGMKVKIYFLFFKPKIKMKDLENGMSILQTGFHF